MEMYHELHAPVNITPENQPPVTHSVRNWVDMEVVKKENFLHLLEFQRRFLGRSPRSLVSIWSELSRVFFFSFGATAHIWALAYLHETFRFTSVY
jgi:hypothetical protein